jgi:hypothetical protein
MTAPGYTTPRDDQSGQLLLEGLHDTCIVGLSLLEKNKLSLKCSQRGEVRELYVQGDKEVLIFGEGLFLPCIVGAFFLNPPRDRIFEVIPDTMLKIVRNESTCYLRETAWMLVVTASYGNGFVIMGSGSQPQVFWRP